MSKKQNFGHRCAPLLFDVQQTMVDCSSLVDHLIFKIIFFFLMFDMKDIFDSISDQYDQIGWLLEVLDIKFLYKIAQTLNEFLGKFEKYHFYIQMLCLLLGATNGIIWATFSSASGHTAQFVWWRNDWTTAKTFLA